MCYCGKEENIPMCFFCIPQLLEDKNQGYSERNVLVSVLAMGMALMPSTYTVYRSKHPATDKSWDDDWRNVLVIEYVHATEGKRQFTWHFHDSEFALIKMFPFIDRYTWDGHTTEQKYANLFGDFFTAYQSMYDV